MPATSTLLTGLSLATGIAREATDGVPIVKQVLGVASRIVGLAEQIDKNREDLHALADRAKRMESTIATVVADREHDDHLRRRLEDMNGVLHAVEKHFVDYIKQGRVRKTLRSILTVRKDVDRLKAEFDSRLKELEVAANLDTNITTRENSRFNGQFRNIRDCEVDLLRRITLVEKTGKDYTINCHLASCEGCNQVVVVRYIVGSIPDEYERQRLEDHDKILERMSLVENRHPNLACLYGKNSEPKHNRFAVLKAGNVRPLRDVLGEYRTDLSLLGHIVVRLLDAACHLQKYNASWECNSLRELCLDDHYEPKIGVTGNLVSMLHDPVFIVNMLEIALSGILDRAVGPSYCHATLPSATWSTELFGELTDAGYDKYRWQTMVLRAEVASLVPLNQESHMYLCQPGNRYIRTTPTLGEILLTLAKGIQTRTGSILFGNYILRPDEEHEDLYVCCIDDDEDAVYYTETHFVIPGSAAEEVRKQLGIPKINMDDWGVSYQQHSSGPNATSIECTGWDKGVRFQRPW